MWKNIFVTVEHVMNRIFVASPWHNKHQKHYDTVILAEHGFTSRYSLTNGVIVILH